MKNMPSIETQKEMVKFFMRTSAPRIVARKKKELEVSRNTINKTES